MSASRLERSRMPSPHDCKRSPTLIVCVAVASAAAGVVFSVILPLLGHLVPVLQYTLPEHRKTTLGRYRLVARDSRKHQRHKSGKAESSQCSDPPPSPNSDTTTSSIESHSSPAKCRAPLRRAKTVIRVRRGQPEWLANVNEWRRRSTAYSASIVESCQTRIGRMNLTRRSATQMSISTLSPRSSVSDPTFEPPLSSSSTVTFRDPFQPASLGSSAKSFKECTVPLSTQHPLDPARTYRDMALEQTSDYCPLPVRKGNAALNGVVPWRRRKSKDFGPESIEVAGYGRRLSLRKLYKTKTSESN